MTERKVSPDQIVRKVTAYDLGKNRWFNARDNMCWGCGDCDTRLRFCKRDQGAINQARKIAVGECTEAISCVTGEGYRALLDPDFKVDQEAIEALKQFLSARTGEEYVIKTSK